MTDTNNQFSTNQTVNHRANPILSMISFNMSVVFQKKNTWILLAIFAIIILIVSAIPKMVESSAMSPIYGFDYGLYSTMVNVMIGMVSTFTILSSGIQGILRGLNIFRDTQREGVEILILSKPITRMQVVLARFLFLLAFSICLSLINMLMVVIGLAIDDINLINIVTWGASGAIIGGAFGATLLSFIVMALIAVAIGIAGSGKASTTWPMVILFVSWALQVGIGMIQMFVIQPTNISLENKVVDQMNNDLNSGKTQLSVMRSYEYISSVTNPSPDAQPPQVYQVRKFGYIDKFSSSSSSFINLLSYDYFTLSGAVEIYTDYNSDYSESLDIRKKEVVASGNSYSYVVNEFTLNGTPDSNFKDYIFNIIKNIGSVGASGIVAVNYLNPVSALSAICGTGSSPLSTSSSGSSNTYDLAANYSMNFTPASPFNNSVFTYSYEQADPAWGVALVWTAIMIGLAGLIIWSYMKHDFK